ncbi:hypothetical protein Dimus_024028, partial [Dionaea muscipula]
IEIEDRPSRTGRGRRQALAPPVSHLSSHTYPFLLMWAISCLIPLVARCHSSAQQMVDRLLPICHLLFGTGAMIGDLSACCVPISVYSCYLRSLLHTR